MLINSPLSVPLSKNKKFIMNLNNYRNAHYQVLNNAKIAYKGAMADQIANMRRMVKVRVHYTLYPKTRRLTDIGNVVSIHKKFFEDALVEFGKLEDDNYKHITSSSESFGEVDKDNPRVEIEVFGI